MRVLVCVFLVQIILICARAFDEAEQVGGFRASCLDGLEPLLRV